MNAIDQDQFKKYTFYYLDIYFSYHSRTFFKLQKTLSEIKEEVEDLKSLIKHNMKKSLKKPKFDMDFNVDARLVANGNVIRKVIKNAKAKAKEDINRIHKGTDYSDYGTAFTGGSLFNDN